MNDASRCLPRVIASCVTIASGAGFIGVGIGSVLVRGALFSWGVGIMLALYGLLVAAAGWACWRGVSLATGAVIASALLNAATVASYATGPLWWVAALILAIPLASLVAAIWLRIQTASQAGFTR